LSVATSALVMSVLEDSDAAGDPENTRGDP
jgi:hypothetical protein